MKRQRPFDNGSGKPAGAPEAAAPEAKEGEYETDDELPDYEALSQTDLDQLHGRLARAIAVMPIPTEFPLVNHTFDWRHFRINAEFVEETRRLPPQFKRIGKCIYHTGKPLVRQTEVKCTCSSLKPPRCHPNTCANALTGVECTPMNCSCPQDCANRQLQQPPFKVSDFKELRTEGKGWGLVCKKDIAEGQLVLEYVGEVLSEAMMDVRIREAAERKERDFYMMAIDNDHIIDARFKGSVSRLINHSCDPNCAIIVKEVAGVKRIGIFAIKDIASGTELAYDYQTFSNSKERCLCGSANCRGYLSVAVAKEQAAKAATAQVVRYDSKKMATAFRRAKARAIDAAAKKNERLMVVHQFQPGGELYQQVPDWEAIDSIDDPHRPGGALMLRRNMPDDPRRSLFERGQRLAVQALALQPLIRKRMSEANDPVKLAAAREAMVLANKKRALDGRKDGTGRVAFPRRPKRSEPVDDRPVDPVVSK